MCLLPPLNGANCSTPHLLLVPQPTPAYYLANSADLAHCHWLKSILCPLAMRIWHRSRSCTYQPITVCELITTADLAHANLAKVYCSLCSGGQRTREYMAGENSKSWSASSGKRMMWHTLMGLGFKEWKKHAD